MLGLLEFLTLCQAGFFGHFEWCISFHHQPKLQYQEQRYPEEQSLEASEKLEQ
jgi:hypothetical protein